MKDPGMNPDSNFSNGNNVRTPNQFRSDRDNPSIFKAHFPSRKDYSVFTEIWTSQQSGKNVLLL